MYTFSFHQSSSFVKTFLKLGTNEGKHYKIEEAPLSLHFGATENILGHTKKKFH